MIGVGTSDRKILESVTPTNFLRNSSYHKGSRDRGPPFIILGAAIDCLAPRMGSL